RSSYPRLDTARPHVLTSACEELQAMRLKKSLQGAAAAATLAMGASTALAQVSGTVALDRFDPAPAGDRMFAVPSPYAEAALTPNAMLPLDYAHNPLVLHTVPGEENRGSVVQNQLYLNLDVALSLWNRLFIDVDVPVALAQGGDSPRFAGQTFTSPSGAQFG